MQSTLNPQVARAQAEARLRKARHRAVAAQTFHPPSPVRWRVASAVARLALSLDADAARRAFALK